MLTAINAYQLPRDGARRQEIAQRLADAVFIRAALENGGGPLARKMCLGLSGSLEGWAGADRMDADTRGQGLGRGTCP